MSPVRRPNRTPAQQTRIYRRNMYKASRIAHLPNTGSTGGSTGGPATGDGVLLETGDFVLLESGDFLLLE